MPLNQRSRRLIFSCLLLLAFLFRLGFGLSSQFQDEDTKQIYLLGLKFYTTGAWPYFGPDVTPTIQIPGALQGLVVGLPLYILPLPEAPYVLLNVLSFSSLCFFAWYCSKRLPELPKWFVWSWLLTAPWALNLSTHIYNPSYVLPGAILFFVGALESYPFLSRGLVPRHSANFMRRHLRRCSLFVVLSSISAWPPAVSNKSPFTGSAAKLRRQLEPRIIDCWVKDVLEPDTKSKALAEARP